MEKSLIVYYSRAGENYVSGQIKVLDIGSTELAARSLCDITGADIFRIVQTEPYSDMYNDCIEEARADRNNDARPSILRCPGRLDGYDVIYLGYPNYWGTMPMAVFTYLESCDMSGIRICPFCTHEGGGLGNSVGDIRRLCPASDVSPGLAIRGSAASKSEPLLRDWIERIRKEEQR